MKIQHAYWVIIRGVRYSVPGDDFAYSAEKLGYIAERTS